MGNFDGMVENVRFGVIGLGSMGAVHAKMLLDGSVPRAALAAVCDTEVEMGGFFPARPFPSSEELIRSGLVDAVVIATPHYHHSPAGIDALQQGLHVLIEKPISVHKADCEKLIAAHTEKRQVFAAMFNQRTDPHYLKVRELVRSGELGKINRINWIITNWFRSQAYYSASEWRATWAGEGGGVLLNQCPHNLDLLQWIFGMPKTVHAFCQLGRHHEIEVEDEVTAYLEFGSGASGVFITSTGEAPGTNRLEIAAEHGRLLLEKGRLVWHKTEVAVAEYSRTTQERWQPPATVEIEIPVNGNGEQHLGIFKNFVAAVLDGEPLIAPAAEGIHSVEMANAMIYSSHLEQTVALPLDGVGYAEFLQRKISDSRFKKKVVPMTGPRDLANSFGSH